MVRAARARWAIGILFAVSVSFLLASGSGAAAATDESKTLPAQCDQLLKLPSGTSIQFSYDTKYLNAEVCSAYADLIKQYHPGECSKQGLSDPQREGIVKLNPDFAVALDKMLKAMPANLNAGINSAYRTKPCPNADGVAAQDSSHMYGCAVDLAYYQKNCETQACIWVKDHASNYGLQVRIQASPEWSHIEPGEGIEGVNECKAKKPGGGVVPGAPGPVAGPGGSGPVMINGKSYTICNNAPLIVVPVGQSCAAALANYRGGPSIGSGNCITDYYIDSRGVKHCNNTYSPFGGNGLFGGNSDLMKMMLGMQLGQGLGQMLGGLFNGSGSSNNTQPTPAALPPAPLPPVTTTPTTLPSTTGYSTIDKLIAALTNPTASTSSSTTTAPSITVGNSPMGVLQATSSPPGGTSGGQAFFATPASGAAPLIVNFSATVVKGNYFITFGDGASSTLQVSATAASQACPPPFNPSAKCVPGAVSHTYAAPGTYTASLATASSAVDNCPAGYNCSVLQAIIGTVTVSVTDGTNAPPNPTVSGSNSGTSAGATSTVQAIIDSLNATILSLKNFVASLLGF